MIYGASLMPFWSLKIFIHVPIWSLVKLFSMPISPFFLHVYLAIVTFVNAFLAISDFSMPFSQFVTYLHFFGGGEGRARGEFLTYYHYGI